MWAKSRAKHQSPGRDVNEWRLYEEVNTYVVQDNYHRIKQTAHEEPHAYVLEDNLHHIELLKHVLLSRIKVTFSLFITCISSLNQIV